MPLYCLLQTQVTSFCDCCNECVLFSLAIYPTIRFCPPRVQFRIVSHCRLQSPSETQGMTSPSSRGSVGVSRGHSGSTGVTPEAQQESMLQRPCKGHSRGSTGVTSEAQQESLPRLYRSHSRGSTEVTPEAPQESLPRLYRSHSRGSTGVKFFLCVLWLSFYLRLWLSFYLRFMVEFLLAFYG